jgi:hypothetical protein
MKWITRERPKIDRIACPWLVARFIDEAPEFLYVPAGDVMRRRRHRRDPYDVPNVELGHHDDRCSFDAFIEKYQLIDPALNKLALIVRAADCGQPAGEGGGRPAGHLEGLSLNFADDHEMLKAGMVMYDALYAWCAPEEDRAARAEVMLLPGRARRACCRRRGAARLHRRLCRHPAAGLSAGLGLGTGKSD